VLCKHAVTAATLARSRLRETRGMVTESWSIRHFSQSNPEGAEQGDVPRLLRRVADSIEALGPVEVQDVTFQTEITAEGPWHSMTVYFHPSGDG
jgi:hypothetical protein